jgi:hypothetical protein
MISYHVDVCSIIYIVLGVPTTNTRSIYIVLGVLTKNTRSTATRFDLARAKPSRFLVYRLNHSATLSLIVLPWSWIEHETFRSSVLRSPNWAIKAICFGPSSKVYIVYLQGNGQKRIGLVAHVGDRTQGLLLNYEAGALLLSYASVHTVDNMSCISLTCVSWSASASGRKKIRQRWDSNSRIQRTIT